MIAREGLPFIGGGLIVSLMVLYVALKADSWILWTVTAVLAVLTLFFVFFFRDPDRHVDADSGVLVAPADGKIVLVEELDHHQFVGGPALQVSIFLSVFDVHVNRVPATGVVDYVKYMPGKFIAAFKEKASTDNEQTEIGMTTEVGHRIVFKQIAGLIARRIVCRLSEGDSVSAGSRCGMIRFGSRTDLIVPGGTRLEVERGDHVRGGASVMGYLPGKPSSAKPRGRSTQGHNVKL